MASDGEEWLLVIMRLLLRLLLLLCKRIETVLRHSARLLCGKLAVLSLTKAMEEKRCTRTSITRKTLRRNGQHTGVHQRFRTYQSHHRRERRTSLLSVRAPGLHASGYAWVWVVETALVQVATVVVGVGESHSRGVEEVHVIRT